MENLFIVDAHEDIAFHLSFFERDFVNPKKPCMITLPWLKKGGVRLIFNTIFVHPKHRPHQTVEKALEQLQIYEQIYIKHKDEVVKVTTAKDLDNLYDNGKTGFLTLMEGADPVENVEHLEFYHRKGVKILGPAWNNQNKYASGPETKKGLSELGIQLINKMNELKITLDISHLNEKCFWQSIELTNLIPIATHSNARSITDHPRNLNDDQLLAISKKGGVIGIVFYNSFVKTSDRPPTLEDIFGHIEYIVNLCGEDHVGIGTDLDGGNIDEFPEEIRKISELPNVAKYFIDKGFSEKRVRKIMGENFLRVLRNNLS